MSRLPPARRRSTDSLLIELLKDGERKVKDVLDEFAAKGFNRNDYRASRYRIGAKVRIADKVGPKARVWYIRLDHVPELPPREAYCGPRRGRVRTVVRYTAEQEDRINKKIRELDRKIAEVDEWLGKYKPDRASYTGPSAIEKLQIGDQITGVG